MTLAKSGPSRASVTSSTVCRRNAAAVGAGHVEADQRVARQDHPVRPGRWPTRVVEVMQNPATAPTSTIRSMPPARRCASSPVPVKAEEARFDEHRLTRTRQGAGHHGGPVASPAAIDMPGSDMVHMDHRQAARAEQRQQVGDMALGLRVHPVAPGVGAMRHLHLHVDDQKRRRPVIAPGTSA